MKEWGFHIRGRGLRYTSSEQHFSGSELTLQRRLGKESYSAYSTIWKPVDLRNLSPLLKGD